MANSDNVRPFSEADAGPGGTTTLVRADDPTRPEESPALHPHLLAQLKEARLRAASAGPAGDLAMLLPLVSAQYKAADQERRGVAQSMRLMADEAHALAHEAREQNTECLQHILDLVQDVVLTTDAEGIVSAFNPSGERVFGFGEAEVVGRRLDLLLPRIAGSDSVRAALQRLSATPGDARPEPPASLDLEVRECWGKHRDGQYFPVEIAVARAQAAQPPTFIICLRDVAERRRAEEALRESEARFHTLFESIAEGVYLSDPQGRLRSVNPAFVSILGYARAEELYALPSVEALYWDPADRADFQRRLESEGEIRNAEFLMRRRDGEQVAVLENARAVRDGAERIVGYEGTIADITERKRAEQAVFAEKERAQVTLQSIGDAVISTDADGRIEYINPIAEALTAWSLDEARGRPLADVLNLVNEITREPIDNPLMCALGRNEGGGSVDHSVLITRAGQEVAIQESAAPICDRQGRVIGAVIVFHDVTKERRLRRALSYQASHDALTGLINRREFDNRLHTAVLNAQRGEAACALLYVDLDQFKVVNDTCGHPAGDSLLRDVTGLLQARVRTSDTIARLGGDEFGVLLEGCTLEQATRIADGIRQAIRDFRFQWGASTLSVGASVGVVQIKSDTESVAAVMSAADLACYAAKDEGRNRIHVYEPDGTSHRHREMHWVARVTRAVDDNRLELYFQPIAPIDPQPGLAGAGRVIHELTVRLRDDDGRLVPPGEFIPAAERYNVMSVIDRWVLVRAAELLGARRAAAAPLPLLAVNVSGNSLNEQSFVEFVLQALKDPDIAAALCFEITETAAVTNLSSAMYFMRELKARGCKFSLDDFGTGLSSFMYLKTLPVDFLKIDGQFIGQVAEDPVDRSMVEAICKVGRALGIATVAECVESQSVLDELMRIGVDYAQGFLIAAPLPISELKA